MISLSLLESRGVSSKAWQKKFEETNNPDPLVDNFRKRAWARCNDGIDNNFKAAKFFHAVDLAWDSTFAQAGPTLLKAFKLRLDNAGDLKNREDVFRLVTDFGLGHSLVEVTDPKTGQKRKAIDIPTFFNVTIPVVKGYCLIRAAKLNNDRQLDPFFKFEPLYNDPENRAKCELLTRRIQVTATQYGYSAVRRDAILKMLMYGVVLKFIDKEWDEEKQLDRDGKEYLVREGLRYQVANPARTYWDRAYSVYTLLTDTGCRWAGHWYLQRYSEVRNNPAYWNKDKVGMGTDLIATHQEYFTTVYPCAMRFPQIDNPHENSGDIDRYYTSTQDDAAVLKIEHQEQIIPKEVGLGDYAYPIWARFVFAGNGTVIYAAPLPGPGVIPYADVFDSQRQINSSFAMDLIPFQDGISNSLTQAILSAERNQKSITFWDTDMVDKKHIDALENMGHQLLTGTVYVPFSSRANRMGQTGEQNRSVFTVTSPQLNVQECIMILNTWLNILERVMQISAQETGAAASHEQTVEEVTQTGKASSARLQFSGTPIDWATDAWKQQNYKYHMAYGEEDIFVQLPSSTRVTRETLENMGFTVEEHDTRDDKDARYSVRGKKKALLAMQLELFASTKEDLTRTSQVEVAGAMSQVIQAVFKSPMLTEAIGPDQAVKLMNQVLERMGLPRDFKLENVGDGLASQIMPMVQKMLEENQQQLVQSLQPLIDTTKDNNAKIDALGQVVAKLESIVNLAQNQIPQNESPEGIIPTRGSPGAQGMAYPPIG